MTEAHAGDGAPARPDRPDGAGASGPGTDTLARIVFAALVVACFAAFLITQRLKHTPTAVQNFKLATAFSPGAAGHTKQESISFKLAHADTATVQIIDSRGNVVATLVHELPIVRYKQFSLRWNGRRGSARRYSQVRTAAGHAILVPHNRGAPAPAGEYRVRITLHGRSQPILSPRSFQLVAP